MNRDFINSFSTNDMSNFLTSRGYFVEKVNGKDYDFSDQEYDSSIWVAWKDDENVPDDIDNKPYIKGSWYRKHNMKLIFYRELKHKLLYE